MVCGAFQHSSNLRITVLQTTRRMLLQAVHDRHMHKVHSIRQKTRLQVCPASSTKCSKPSTDAAHQTSTGLQLGTATLSCVQHSRHHKLLATYCTAFQKHCCHCLPATFRLVSTQLLLATSNSLHFCTTSTGIPPIKQHLKQNPLQGDRYGWATLSIS